MAVSKLAAIQAHELLRSQYGPFLWPRERGAALWEGLKTFPEDIFLQAIDLYVSDTTDVGHGKVQGQTPPTIAQIKSHAQQLMATQEKSDREQQTRDYEKNVVSFPDPDRRTLEFKIFDTPVRLSIRVRPSRCSFCGDSGWARFYIMGADWHQFFTVQEVDQWPEEMQPKAKLITAICRCDHPKAVHNRTHLHPRILRCADVLRTRERRQLLAGG